MNSDKFKLEDDREDEGRNPAIEHAPRKMTLRHLVTRRAIIAISLVGAIVALGLVGARMTGDPADSEAIEGSDAVTVLPVKTELVLQATGFEIEHVYTGQIVARRTSELGFERAGKLIELQFDEGDRIEEGQALAVIDSRRLAARRREVRARRAQAAARLRELEAGPRRESIEAARARTRDLAHQLDLSRAKETRREDLLANSSISPEERDEVAFGARALEARLEESTQALEELEAGTRSEVIDAQRALVDQLDAGLAEIDIDLTDSTLRAPFAGRIARRHADEGSVVAAGEPIARLIEDKALEAWIGVPVGVAAELTEGEFARLLIGSTVREGTVAAVLPELDPATRTKTVVFDIAPSEESTIGPGQVVRFRHASRIEQSGFWLPTHALVRSRSGLWACFSVVTAGDSAPSGAELPGLTVRYRVERREVEVLHAAGDRVFVGGTLSDGDRVITSGAHRVVAGQIVQLAEEETGS